MSQNIQVTVTGGSGFLGSYCIVDLLKQGYKVKTTIRNLSKESELRDTLSRFVTYKPDQLEFYEADLNHDKNWDAAIEGSTYVLHVASPFLANIPKDPEKELIQPAIQGTIRVLEASQKNGVKRVVMTSSMAAISYGHPYPQKTAILDEQTWTNIDGDDVTPYVVSKTLAEKAAWDFIEKNSSLELTTINPSAIIGPLLSSDLSPSILIIKKLMNKEMPALPKIGFQVTDVRDVTSAHIKAMTKPDAAGKRVAVTNQFLWMQDFAKILSKEFSSKGYSIPSATIPDYLVKIFALFDKETRSVLNELGIKRELSNERMKQLLGITPIDVSDSVISTAQSLIQNNVLKTKK